MPGSGSFQPKSDTSHDDSTGCMNPLKDIKAGARDPIGQRINPDSRFYITSSKKIKKNQHYHVHGIVQEILIAEYRG
jgi:hypothetical protein